MSNEILMPALSPTMTEGRLAKWFVKKGDSVESGDVIAEIETDKATMEVEAVDDGIIKEIAVEEGSDNIPVNSVIAVLENANAVDIVEKTIPQTSIEQEDALPTKPEQNALDAQSDNNIARSSAIKAEYIGKVKQMSVRNALCEAMAEEMRLDGSVFLMGEEVAEYQGAYKVSQGLLDEFGAGRVIDTPITEHGFAGLGIGASFAGLKPIVEFMTFNFAMQAIDQIINSAAKTLYMSGGQMGSQIVFRGANGAASRVGAQHSQCFASWYAHCPGLKVVAPCFADDAKGLLKSSIRDPNPIIFLENEILYASTNDVPDTSDWLVPIGKARVCRVGKDVTIVAFSIMVLKALEAAEELATCGIDAEVIDLRTIRPIDIDAIVGSVKKTSRIVTVEEGWAFSGVGAEISAQVCERAFDWLDHEPVRVAGLDVPMPYAANLEKLALPQVKDIIAAAKKTLYME